MKRLFPFTERPPTEKPAAFEFGTALFSRKHSAGGYLPDAGLVDAVNVALLLGQPLLVTGEPGTGKTAALVDALKSNGTSSRPNRSSQGS
jgi:Cdc6-like AAA superfamily ATPase